MKKTKIIATISNKSCSVDLLEQMYQAGMDVVRLNTAHQSLEDALPVIENIRAVSDRIAIMIDTKGPEIRTMEIKEPIAVKSGDVVHIKGASENLLPGECVCVSYDRFAEDVSLDDRILIDDGDIELQVLEKSGDTLRCIVKNDGFIRGRKSINVPSVNIRHLPSLSEKDKAFIAFAADHGVDFIAHSFVRRKEDILAVQEILDQKGSPIKIIAKIENQDGLDNIDEILDHAYGAMIARGDLAIEVPAEKIPIIQKNLVKKCIERRKPVIIATQMLQSMVVSPRPTRAEVSDVANACLDRTDAVMLSGETANGKYPLEAVKMMSKIANEVETSRSTFTDTVYETQNTVTSYLSKAAVKASMRLNSKALIADTISGRTILSLAAYRGESPIYAQCYDKRVMRELALSYGVMANYMERDLTSHLFLQKALTRLLEEKEFTENCLITVLAGNFGSDCGASYVEISTAKNLLKRK
ncbi:MAG: pyruvate kinase [Desulfobacterales bacterium]|nr:pyruvate kinase [Desulfobacterales bacterium]